MSNKRDIKDYIGKRFGHLTVIGQAPKTHPCSNRFLFQCDCGVIFAQVPSNIIRGQKTSCGNCEYSQSHHNSEEKCKDLIGKRFGKLVVIDVIHKEYFSYKTMLLCQCDCGNTYEAAFYPLTHGQIKSCGCGRAKAGFRDGRSKRNPNLYTLWAQMLSRCENPDNKWYYRYGGRGIKVCEEWHDYLKFEEWVESNGGKPKGMSLDRIDNNSDYCPENCKWSTQKEQTRNTNRNVNITYNGKTQCLSDWANELGVTFSTLEHRYHRGWDVERMLTTPMQKKSK